MDKIIEKKKGWRSAFTKKAMPYWLGAIVVVFVLYLVFRDNSKTLRVDMVPGEFLDIFIRLWRG